MKNNSMPPQDRRAAIALSAIFSLRMLGLFLILPVFALYATDHLSEVTPTLVGLAIGIYGLTQALLQIPFGVISDRWGRKRIIAVGLIIFAIGSAIAALSTSIWGVIVGRALQGAGAISGPVMALTADLTQEEHRTKAMAMIGVSIGMSFALAIVIAPAVAHWIGVSGIFWLIALLAMIGLVLLYTAVPNPRHSAVHRDAEAVPDQVSGVWGNVQLRRLDFGILALHAILTSNWVVVPAALRVYLPTEHHWWIYLPVIVIAMGAMVPFVIIAEKHGRMKPIFLGAVATLAVAELLLATFNSSLVGIAVALAVFFIAFNLLEATLPSLVSKIAPPDAKGTAMGIYATTQFLGAFLGGALGGFIYGHFGLTAVFLGGAGLALLWLGIATGMSNPRTVKTHLISISELNEDQARILSHRLRTVRGVIEAVVIPGDRTAYLKVDSPTLDEIALATVTANLIIE